MKPSLLSAFLTLLLPWLSTPFLQADIRPVDVDNTGKKEQKLVPELQKGDGQRLVNVVQEGENNLKEIQKLLDEIQKNLADRDTGKPTQEKQKEVVEKMTSLLEKLESECSKCSSSADPSAREKKSGGDPQSQKDQAQKKAEEQKAREQQKSQAQQQESEKERKDGKVENDRTAEAKPPDAREGNLRARMLEASRRWGILPPKLREEVLFSTGKEAPREYLQIISRYYKRMTEFYEDSRAD